MYFYPIVDDCRNLMNQLPSLKIYCFRKANAYAGDLARKTVNLRHVFCILDSPPMKMSYLLLHEFYGLFCNRICTVTTFAAAL